MNVADHRPLDSSPTLIITTPGSGQARSVVLILPGGRARSVEPARPRNLVNLRMIPFARVARGQLRGQPIAVWRLRYRVRGWNAPVLDPVRDARWALAEVQRRHPGADVHLIGYSMGGRTALRCAGDPAVTSVCVLAPWIEAGEPIAQVAGRRLRIAHGDRDRVTDPRMSQAFAARAAGLGADVRFELVTGDGHALLRRAGRWNDVVREFIAELVATPATG